MVPDQQTGCVLYVHYSEYAKDDYRNWRDDLAGIPLDQYMRIGSPVDWGKSRGLPPLKGVQKVENLVNPLQKLLKGEVSSSKYESTRVLVLFYDAGLRQLLEKIRPILLSELDKAQAKKGIKDDLIKSVTELKFGNLFGMALRKLAEDKGLEDNLRILTALDLVDIFSEMSDVQDLRDYFLGEPGNMSYDSPKIIEAIVRLRLLGSGIPVFRLDQDVLFPSEDIPNAYKKLQDAIDTQLKELKEHHVESTIHSTILSADYEEPEKAIKRGRPSLIAYSRGYATRVQPALLVKPDLLKEIKSGSLKWDNYARRSFDKSIAEKFFDNKSLAEWGAPATGVISGALLYMSDGVVLNIPPFSNFSLNVVWIDDHLRYALHRELGDFAQFTASRPGGGYLHVRSDKCVIKCRTGFENLASYTLCTYLPQLLWGAIFDAWICKEPILKFRRIEQGLDLKKWEEKKEEDWKGNLRGFFAERIKQVQMGRIIRDVVKLRNDLRIDALERIKKVREIWGDLKAGDGTETFASCWARHEVPSRLLDIVDTHIDNTDYSAEKKKADKEIARGLPDDIILGSVLGNQLEQLITDAVGYLRWAQKWPQVVMVVRSIKRGTLESDL